MTTKRTLTEDEFRQEIIDLVNELEVETVPTVAFNERVLDAAAALLTGRTERRLARRAKAPRTAWCEAECAIHQFHDAGGTPIDWNGNPVPVDQPYRHTPKQRDVREH